MRRVLVLWLVAGSFAWGEPIRVKFQVTPADAEIWEITPVGDRLLTGHGDIRDRKSVV